MKVLLVAHGYPPELVGGTEHRRVGGGQPTASHLDEDADQAPDHLPDEMRSLDVNQYQVAVLVNLHDFHEHLC